MGFRIVGLNLQSFCELLVGFFHKALPGQGHAQVIVRIGLVRFQIDRLLQLRNGLIHAPLRLKRQAKIVARREGHQRYGQ